MAPSTIYWRRLHRLPRELEINNEVVVIAVLHRSDVARVTIADIGLECPRADPQYCGPEGKRVEHPLKTRFAAFIPLAFLTMAVIFILMSQREFERRISRDNADFRQDLQEAGVSRAEAAALLAATTKLEASASSYAQIISFVGLFTAVFMAVPLYARMRLDDGRKKSAPAG